MKGIRDFAVLILIISIPFGVTVLLPILFFLFSVIGVIAILIIIGVAVLEEDEHIDE